MKIEFNRLGQRATISRRDLSLSSVDAVMSAYRSAKACDDFLYAMAQDFDRVVGRDPKLFEVLSKQLTETLDRVQTVELILKHCKIVDHE